MMARIIPATFRDLSYVASRLRDEDREEAEAQIGPFHYIDFAAMHLTDRSYVVTLDGNPEAAFGAGRLAGDHLWVCWSWGSRRIGRCVPLISRFVRDAMIPDLIENGAWRAEARALASHTGARRWLTRMGATERCELPAFGRNGETFILYDWVRHEHD
jgi:hypothetical protein